MSSSRFMQKRKLRHILWHVSMQALTTEKICLPGLNVTTTTTVVGLAGWPLILNGTNIAAIRGTFESFKMSGSRTERLRQTYTCPTQYPLAHRRLSSISRQQTVGRI